MIFNSIFIVQKFNYLNCFYCSEDRRKIFFVEELRRSVETVAEEEGTKRLDSFVQTKVDKMLDSVRKDVYQQQDITIWKAKLETLLSLQSKFSENVWAEVHSKLARVDEASREEVGKHVRTIAIGQLERFAKKMRDEIAVLKTRIKAAEIKSERHEN